MPKVIQSVANQLVEAQRQIAEAEREIEKLRQRNIELTKGKLSLGHRLSRYESSEYSNVPRSGRETPPANYLQPTAASRNRVLHRAESSKDRDTAESTKSQHVAVIQGVRCVYEGGVITSRKGEPGYLRETNSSRRKTSVSLAARHN